MGNWFEGRGEKRKKPPGKREERGSWRAWTRAPRSPAVQVRDRVCSCKRCSEGGEPCRQQFGTLDLERVKSRHRNWREGWGIVGRDEVKALSLAQFPQRAQRCLSVRRTVCRRGLILDRHQTWRSGRP